MVMPAEVIYQRAGHYLVFNDGSGYQGNSEDEGLGEGTVIGAEDISALDFIIEHAPKDLKLVKKKNLLVLQRKIAGISYQVMSAQQYDQYTQQQESNDQALALQAFSLVCVVQDKNGHYHPQRLNISLNNQVKHSVELYRSVKGSQFRASGGVYAQLRYSDQLPASWALMQVSISMPNGLPALVFKAQADINGDVLLAFDRLPMPNLANDNAQYSCTLTIQSDYALATDKNSMSSNIDSFSETSLALQANDLSQLSELLVFDFHWGDRMRVSSENAAVLYLQAAQLPSG